MDVPASDQAAEGSGECHQLRPEDAVAKAGIDGPLLVVATSPTVSRYAPAWAAACGRDQGGYRVLVVREDDPGEAEQIVAEATAMLAVGIIAIGNATVIAAARAAGRQLERPVVAVPTDPFTA